MEKIIESSKLLENVPQKVTVGDFSLALFRVDDNVYVLRIDDTEGTPTHCAFTFGCHALCNN